MADTTVLATALNSHVFRSRVWGPYWYSTTVGCMVALDSLADLNIYRTSNGGANWTEQEVTTNPAARVAVWWEPETPGRSNRIVHIHWVEESNSVIRYQTFDPSDNSLGTERTIATLTGTAQTVFPISLTMTRNGNLLIAGRVDTITDTTYCYRSTDGGANWTSRSSPAEDSVLDQLMLYPANTGDDADAVAWYFDDSATEVSIKMYDDSGDSWTETSVETSVDIVSLNEMIDGAVRHSDGHLILAAWDDPSLTDSTLRIYDVNPNSIASPGVSTLTTVVTASESGAVAVAIDQQTDDIYVGYLKGITTWGSQTDAVYKKSTDGGSTWGSETAYSEAASENNQLIGGPRSIDDEGGFIQWSWFDDDDNDIFVNLVNDVAISANEGASLVGPLVSGRLVGGHLVSGRLAR